jgi:hypothetical protein
MFLGGMPAAANFPANCRKQGSFSVSGPNRLARIESFPRTQWLAPNPLQRLAGKKFSLLRGLAGKKQGMATVEPRAALEPPPAASFATDARTRKAHITEDRQRESDKQRDHATCSIWQIWQFCGWRSVWTHPFDRSQNAPLAVPAQQSAGMPRISPTHRRGRWYMLRSWL